MRQQNLYNYKLPNNWSRGNSFLYESLWVMIFQPIVSSFLPGSYWRRIVLTFFGAKLGKSIRLNIGLKVKFPWKLVIGDYSWIGENTWIDNIEFVRISDNVCVSQGVYFCTGNHNYKKPTFDFFASSIKVDSHAWIGAKSIIGPGYKIGKGSVITMGSVIKENIPPGTIYKNNKINKI